MTDKDMLSLPVWAQQYIQSLRSQVLELTESIELYKGMIQADQIALALEMYRHSLLKKTIQEHTQWVRGVK